MFETIVSAQKAIADENRLRLLLALREGELTVGELTQILAQSQPGVSRHLKILADAKLIERQPEGAFVFYRLQNQPPFGPWLAATLNLIDVGDPALQSDRQRLIAIKAERQLVCEQYFRDHAASWAEERKFFGDPSSIDAAILQAVGSAKIDQLIDLGTGTGHILTLLADQVGDGLGIDSSAEMLALARQNLEQAGLTHCRVRAADVTALPCRHAQVDWVTMVQVLHYLDRPTLVFREVARVLRPGGQFLIVDLATHTAEHLRQFHKHRRLGFADQDIQQYGSDAGLTVKITKSIAETRAPTGETLIVKLWQVEKPKRLTPVNE